MKYPPYQDLTAVLPENIELCEIRPNKLISKPSAFNELLESALFNPIGTPNLSELIKLKRRALKKERNKLKILVLTDDITRVTPVRRIFPNLLIYLGDCGISSNQVEILVALGSHREMTHEELIQKFGQKTVDNIKIHQHSWNNEKEMITFGKTESGIDVLVNPLVNVADFIIAIGNIVPHEIAGFSGGYKMIIPGISTLKTVEKIHWLSTDVPMNKRLGNNDNAIRYEINKAGCLVGLDFIINTVLDADQDVIGIYTGDPVKAQQKGAEFSAEIFSAKKAPTDIIITDTIPEHTDLWTTAKAIIHTAGFVNKGGIMIVAGSCPEGVCPTHPQILEMGYNSPAILEKQYLQKDNGEYNRLTATHCANIWEVQQHCDIYLVTQGISEDECKKLGIRHFSDLQVAIDAALMRKPKIKIINLIEHGSEIMQRR